VDTFQPTISVAAVATRNPAEIHIAHCTQQQNEKRKTADGGRRMEKGEMRGLFNELIY